MTGFPNGGMMPNWPSGDTLVNNAACAVTPAGCTGPNAAQISTVMQSVLSGGAAAVMQNPMAAANSALSGSASSAASAINTALGASAATLVAALTGAGGLTASLATHLSFTNAMSGVSTPSTGQYGPMGPRHTCFIGAAVLRSPGVGAVQRLHLLRDRTADGRRLICDDAGADRRFADERHRRNDDSCNGDIDGQWHGGDGFRPGFGKPVGDFDHAVGGPAMASVMTMAAACTSTSAGLSQVAQILAPAGSPLAGLVSHIAAISAPSSGQLAAMASFPDAGAARPGARGGM